MSLHILIITVLVDAIFSTRLGENPKPNSPNIYEIVYFKFRLWAPFKSVFDSGQGFPYESSSHIMYKVLYVNSFYSLYYYHHYDLWADTEILKSGGAICQPPWLAYEENFRFQMVQKGQNNFRNYKFLAKYFYQYFQMFAIFIYNESLSMKSYQFFKIYKRFDKERKKHSYSSQWKKKNWEEMDFVL